VKEVVFWGCRGSLPVALCAADVARKISDALVLANGRHFHNREAAEDFVRLLPFNTGSTFGGNSSCVEVVTDGPEHVICDMGTGARPLGQAKIERYGQPRPQVYHVFISHLHWDHLMGFPFFAPMYIAGNHIIVHGCHERMEEAIRLQIRAPCFPVDYSDLDVTMEFDCMLPGKTVNIAGLEVTPKLQPHIGDSYGYRFEGGGKCVVYSTDAEYPMDSGDLRREFTDFFSQADLVIFDAMYSLAEVTSKRQNWGHSCNIIGAEICIAAAVRRMALFHHEPSHDDTQLYRLLEETRRFVNLAVQREQERSSDTLPSACAPETLQVISAHDGLVVKL